MKKLLILGTALASLASIPAANATQLIIQPTIVEAAPVYAAPVYEPAPVVVYPVHHDHHHHYDWRYWNERHEYDRR